MKKVRLICQHFITILSSFMLSTVAFAQTAEEAEPLKKSVQEVATEHLGTAKKLLDLIIEFCVKYSFQVIGGIIVLFIGWLIAKWLAKIVLGFLEKKKIDVTVAKFIAGSVKLTVMMFVGIVALGKFGIEIAPLIAALSVAGVGIGFALQGPLSNFAAGISLIFSKPFKVGDIIEVAGVNGEVVDIKLPKTEIITVDGELIVIPNKHIIGEIIHNYSDSKRLDITVGVSYSADTNKAIQLVTEVIKNDERIVKGKPPKVGISEFADSSVNIYARVWCKQIDYWDVMFDINRNILKAFGENGIEIPFPQRDVHLYNK